MRQLDKPTKESGEHTERHSGHLYKGADEDGVFLPQGDAESRDCDVGDETENLAGEGVVDPKDKEA